MNFPEEWFKKLRMIKEGALPSQTRTRKKMEEKKGSFWLYFSNEAYADMTFKTDSPEVKVIQILTRPISLGKIDNIKLRIF